MKNNVFYIRALTIFLVILFIFCKFYLRTLNLNNGLAIFLLGVSPNFFSAIGMPMFSLWNLHKKEENILKKYDKYILWGLGIFFLLFIYEEYIPTFANSQVFDYWDILFSFFGLTAFYLIYKIYFRTTLNQINRTVRE
ncbi:hypothetical protein [Haliscomenobacter sp.]|uniref:hypothetical protein n=1 Tax=Haliscomenobacter sp. TaxID=2717303 RepID=UPI003BAA18D6